MTINNLTKAIRAKVSKIVEDFRLTTEFEENPRCPRMFNGDLPPKRSDSLDDFPFIIVRFEESESVNEETTATIVIVAGCYTEDYEGHEDCINVLSRIQTALLSMPDGILDNKYILQPPVLMTNLPEQPYPQWQVNMTTKWTFRAPAFEF